jgi:hypothetical protein
VRFSKRPADTGEADPAVVRALDAYARGAGSEHDALTAVAASRLLVPVVAIPEEPPGEGTSGKVGRPGVQPGDSGGLRGVVPPGKQGGGTTPGEGTSGKVGRPGVQPGDSGGLRGVVPPGKQGGGSSPRASTDMALPTLIGNDGRKAIIAFTGMPALGLWREDARPVPVPARLLWQASAQEEAAAVVIDVAGPVPFVVEGARLAALVAGQQPPPPHLDPDIRAEVAAVTNGFTLGPGERDTDLLVTLHTADADAARQAGEEIAMRLAGRLRRGIEVRTW